MNDISTKLKLEGIVTDKTLEPLNLSNNESKTIRKGWIKPGNSVCSYNFYDHGKSLSVSDSNNQIGVGIQTQNQIRTSGYVSKNNVAKIGNFFKK